MGITWFVLVNNMHWNLIPNVLMRYTFRGSNPRLVIILIRLEK